MKEKPPPSPRTRERKRNDVLTVLLRTVLLRRLAKRKNKKGILSLICGVGLSSYIKLFV